MPIPHASTPVLLEHDDQAGWIDAVLSDTVDALRQRLDEAGTARLLLSGGRTPEPIYRALAQAPLDWSRVELALVDERWLPPGHPDSNAHLVRETLLTGHAAAAHFEPMLMPNRGFDETVIAANRSAAPATVVLLGMGPDGHVASLFPGMQRLAGALANPVDYIGVDASSSPGAAPWPRRISLTPSGLARARRRLLLIRGQSKLDILRRALAADDALELPVRVAFSLPGAPLRIHWCP